MKIPAGGVKCQSSDISAASRTMCVRNLLLDVELANVYNLEVEQVLLYDFTYFGKVMHKLGPLDTMSMCGKKQCFWWNGLICITLMLNNCFCMILLILGRLCTN